MPGSALGDDGYVGLIQQLLGFSTGYKNEHLLSGNFEYVSIALTRQQGHLKDYLVISDKIIGQQAPSARTLLSLLPISGKLWVSTVISRFDGTPLATARLENARYDS